MSKTIRKLTLQYSYLQIEEEEVQEMCEEVESEMREALKEHYPEEFSIMYGPQKPQDPSPQSEEEIHKTEPQKKNPDLKKLYRRIASKLHPDKDDFGDDEEFRKAAQAYAEDNIAILLEIAGQYNIELTSLSDETLALLQNNIEMLQKSIVSKKGSAAYCWSQKKTPEERLALLKQLANRIRESNE